MDRQEKLDLIRIEKLQRRGWVMLTLVFDHRDGARFLYFLQKENALKFRGYPKSSAVVKHHADFIYDLKEKKFIKQSVEIAISKAEEVLYGRS